MPRLQSPIPNPFRKPPLIIPGYSFLILLFYYSILDLGLDLDPSHEDFAQKLQSGNEDTEQARNDEMANACPDTQPGPFVLHQPEEIHRQNIAKRHDEHEE